MSWDELVNGGSMKCGEMVVMMAKTPEPKSVFFDFETQTGAYAPDCVLDGPRRKPNYAPSPCSEVMLGKKKTCTLQYEPEDGSEGGLVVTDKSVANALVALGKQAKKVCTTSHLAELEGGGWIIVKNPIIAKILKALVEQENNIEAYDRAMKVID